MAQRRIFQGDAARAQDGPALPGDAERLSRIVELAQADLARLEPVRVLEPAEVQGEQEPLLQLHGHVRELRLGQLERRQRPVEDLPRRGVVDRRVQAVAGRAEGAEHDPEGALRPHERLAALLGGRDVALACEELTLRARADLDAGRIREAALQLRVALEAAIAELEPWRDRGDMAQRLETLREHRGAVGSAANAALRGGLETLRPRGILIQLGLGGDISLPQNTIVAKEIEMRGSFRFHEEYGLAVDLINRRRVDLMPLLTGVLPVEDAVKAFDMASDRSRAMKVQIAF